MADSSARLSEGSTLAAVVRDARLSRWTRIQAEIARLHAEANKVLAAALDDALGEVARSSGLSQAREIPLRAMVAEYATAARMSEVTLEALAFDARRLVTSLPDTQQALAHGEITLGHAREIAQVPIPSDAAPDKVAEFECRVLDRARPPHPAGPGCSPGLSHRRSSPSIRPRGTAGRAMPDTFA